MLFGISDSASSFSERSGAAPPPQMHFGAPQQGLAFRGEAPRGRPASPPAGDPLLPPAAVRDVVAEALAEASILRQDVLPMVGPARPSTARPQLASLFLATVFTCVYHAKKLPSCSLTSCFWPPSQ